MSPIIKNVVRVFKFLILFAAILFLLLVGAVNLPFVHTFLTKKTNTFLAEKGIPVQVGKITLLINGKIGLQQLEIISSGTDTIIYAGKASVDVRPLPLLKKRMIVQNINLANVVANIISDEQTGKLNIVSLFSEKETDEPPQPTEKDTTQTGQKWEIQVRDVNLKNIRFIYSDAQGGIFLNQSLERAEIDFETFSILNKQIDVSLLEIEKPDGIVSIWKPEVDTTESNSPARPWKFSLKNLETRNLHFVLDQPELGQKLEIALQKGNISMENLNLKTREILVSGIELVKPEIVFYQSDSVFGKTEIPTSEEFEIPVFAWSVLAEKVAVKDGTFQVKNVGVENIKSQQQWLPVNDFNIKLSNVRLSPTGYSINLEKLSFNLNHLVEVKSGKIFLETDTLQNAKLTVDFSASIPHAEQSWFAKDKDINFSCVISGSLHSLEIEKLNLNTSSGLDFSIKGYLTEILKLNESECNLNFNTKSITSDQIKEFTTLFNPVINLPKIRPFTLSGNIKNKLLKPSFDIDLRSGSGNIGLIGNFDTKKLNGTLQASFSEILLSEIMGEVYPEKLSGQISWNGGLNNSKELTGVGVVNIDSVRYKNKTTRDINLHTLVENNQCQFKFLASDSSMVFDFDGLFSWNKTSYQGNISGDFNVDANQMKLYPKPFTGKGEIAAAFFYSADSMTSSVDLRKLTVGNGNHSATLNNSKLALNMTDSLILAQVKTNFMEADFKSRASFDDFKKAIDASRFNAIFSLDSTDFVNLFAISHLHSFNLNATANYDSIIGSFVPDSVFYFDNVRLNMNKKSDDSEIQTNISVDRFTLNKINSYNANLTMNLEQDKVNCDISLDSIIMENAGIGSSNIKLDILPGTILGEILILDKKDSLPLYQLGLVAQKVNDQIVLKSSEPEWIINSNKWTLSTSQFLTWEIPTRDLIANVHLAHENMKIDLSGQKSKNLNLDLQNVLFSRILPPALIDFMPDGSISGKLNYSGREHTELNFDFEFVQMKWEDILINKISAQGNLISDTTGILESKITALINDSATITLEMGSANIGDEKIFSSTYSDIPVHLLSPFIKEYVSGLEGTSSGKISMSKKDDKASLDGELRMIGIKLKLIPLNVWLSIPDDKLQIKQSKLYFDQFTVLDSLQKPMIMNGTINFENQDDIIADLNVKLKNIQIMNTTVKDNPMFFGSVLVNSALDVTGSIASPEIKGRIALERGTNVTYRQTQDYSVQEIQREVTFAKIDSNRQIIESADAKIGKMSQLPIIQTSIEINPNSVFNVNVASIYNIDISISGNGLLNYATLPNNAMSLNGGYEITKGTAELKITGWPKKYFTISPGSSFRWSGSIDNPELGLEATSKIKGSYLNPVDNQNRVVDFIVSMKLSNYLSNLNVVFEVRSPDQYITSVINSLPPDEQMKQAVNLLLFEVISLPGIESSTDYLSAQIDGFWESQLNSMTKTSLKKVDLSFGIDTYNQTTATGQQEKTSLTYEMERKFMNDRVSVKLSGRLNDETETGSYQSNSMIDHFIFEYAVDTINEKFLKLYSRKDYEDILEGEVTKSGVGFVYRKSYSKLKDIWQRKEKKKSESKQQSKGKTD